jgi:DNA topoisomerase-1
MATKKKSGKPLVIVESPAKARTIAKYLGSGYVIEASIGHIRDLPGNASEVPPALKGEKWARLGIDIQHDFKPLYVVPKEKREQIRKLKKLLADAPELYLATDEDREGESISWHLVEELAPRVPIRRLVFHEITKAAIHHALEHPREIDRDLVEAQEARRLVDRLYGYEVSPLLWRKIKPRLSAGRVQSVAIRLVVERERERIRFRAAAWWDLEGTFAAPGKGSFDAGLASVGGKRVASGKDFEPTTGKLRDALAGDVLHLDEAGARALMARLAGRPATVEQVERKPYTERPYPPFTTSTLQQEAARKLRFSAQRTMRAAQRLYENGWITYMRTDSTTLSSEALAAARDLIRREFGAQHLPDEPRLYQTKVRNAQEAHEAIRPAGASFAAPAQVAAEVGDDEQKVYDLIWKRTVASQMKDARGQRTSLTLAVGDARFQAAGKTIEYPGYRLAYVEEDEDAETAIADAERILPDVRGGERLEVGELRPKDHATQPPARLTEASLIKELEARGIGRPSTYASIIETILARDYCFKKGTALVPTFTAFAVVQLLDQHLHWLVDYEFTAKMEEELDEISDGRRERLDYLRSFYDGNGHQGLKQALVRADEEIAPQEVCRVMTLDDAGTPIEVRVGRYGPYLFPPDSGDLRVTLPDELPPDELTVEKAQELISKSVEGPRSLGTDPKTGFEVFVKVGRFGPYFQLGRPEDWPKKQKPKMASLLRGMTPEQVTLEEALAVLGLPRELGRRVPPQGTAEEPILAMDGRYGPYLKWGKETRSIPPEQTPLTVTLEQALALFAQPKARGRGRAAATPKVLKELGTKPGGNVAVRVLDGRYGPYVSDGEVNATLPKGETPDAITLPRALELLAAKAARGPAKKPRRAGRAPSKATARSRSD